jgi:acyl dehydratase
MVAPPDSLSDVGAPARRPTTVEDLAARVGGAPFVSRWFVIDQARIDAFAEATEDRQFIHVDPEAARPTPFGGTIAHGFLTLSMLSAFAYDALPEISGLAMGVNYGFDRLRFLSPVPAGARLRGAFKLVGATQRSQREWLMSYEASVEIEGTEKPALAAQWLTMVVTAG